MIVIADRHWCGNWPQLSFPISAISIVHSPDTRILNGRAKIIRGKYFLALFVFLHFCRLQQRCMLLFWLFGRWVTLDIGRRSATAATLVTPFPTQVVRAWPPVERASDKLCTLMGEQPCKDKEDSALSPSIGGWVGVAGLRRSETSSGCCPMQSGRTGKEAMPVRYYYYYCYYVLSDYKRRIRCGYTDITEKHVYRHRHRHESHVYPTCRGALLDSI